MWGFNTTQPLILESKRYIFILQPELAKIIKWSNTSKGVCEMALIVHHS